MSKSMIGERGDCFVINEADVRTWMKRIAGKHLFWVEPARGSTFGLPDAYCAINGLGHLWIELKFGALHRFSDHLSFDLRPEHRATIRRLIDNGGRVALVVGYFGAISHIILRANERVLSGKVHLPQALEADLAVVAGSSATCGRDSAAGARRSRRYGIRSAPPTN